MKNPERYIKTLKKEITRLNTYTSNLKMVIEKLSDKYVVVTKWDEKGYKDTIGSAVVNGDILEFKVGDTFVHKGTVKEVHSTEQGVDLVVVFKEMLRENK